MMLDELSAAPIKLEAHREDATNGRATNGMNFALANSHATFAGPTAHEPLGAHLDGGQQQQQQHNHNHHLSIIAQSAQGAKGHQQQQQHHAHHSQQQQHQVSDEPYFTSDETNSSSYNLNPATPTGGSGSGSGSGVGPGAYHGDSKSNGLLNNGNHQAAHGSPGVNVDSSGHPLLVPTTAHCSEQQANMHYSLSGATSKGHHLATSSPSSMALNFSHDLLQNQSALHQHAAGGGGGESAGAEHKHSVQLAQAAELEQGSSSSHLMQTAANMNMWKSTMGLGFKHSAINEHGFLPAGADMNSFSSWPHANNLGHQTAPNAMAHHILDSQHLIGYSQHAAAQRPLQLPNQQDLVGASLKNQVCAAEQASFMLNSINQASQAQMSNHNHHHHHHNHHAAGNSSAHQAAADNAAGTQHLRVQAHEHNATSYNLSMNDNQFYNNRSHGNTIKSSVFLQDRSGPSHSSSHNSHLAYHSAEHHLNPQPTTSHHVAGSSSGASSRNIGTFKCPHCSEIFSMRNLYQSHLKSHSQEKGLKAKFHCELCGHSFSQKTSLNRHMKSHTGERPFPCEVCGKAFSEKERLKIHMRTHTGEKPFSCGICGKSFSQKSTVKRHQTVHTGEKKFKCDCGKGFANRGNLIAHIKTRGANHFE